MNDVDSSFCERISTVKPGCTKNKKGKPLLPSPYIVPKPPPATNDSYNTRLFKHYVRLATKNVGKTPRVAEKNPEGYKTHGPHTKHALYSLDAKKERFRSPITSQSCKKAPRRHGA